MLQYYESEVRQKQTLQRIYHTDDTRYLYFSIFYQFPLLFILRWLVGYID